MTTDIDEAEAPADIDEAHDASEVDDADDASDAEEKRYERAFVETRRILDESIRRLAILSELELDPDRHDELDRQQLKLDTDRTNLIRANIAYHAGRAVMVPPPAPLVSEIIALSKQ